MYSGTTFRRQSGMIVGVHQKIDRVARRNLNDLILKSVKFPGIRSILHFEGKNGPDGLKIKRSTSDSPWHFIDPTKSDDYELLQIIENHIYNLSEALRAKNSVRAAFEAAWLAHAVTDGLTPAHHYPLDDKIKELFGKFHNELQSLSDKNIIRGKSRRDTISKNWQYWGAGGVFSAHLMYEMGVASAIATEKFESCVVSKLDVDNLTRNGYRTIFLGSVHKISELNMYNDYSKTGWTTSLARDTREKLLPEIIRAVTLAWYNAAVIMKAENL